MAVKKPAKKAAKAASPAKKAPVKKSAASKKAAPAKAKPKKLAAKKPAAKAPVAKKAAAKKVAPKKASPVKAKTAAAKKAPIKKAPAKPTPTKATPKKAAPKKTAPKKAAPKKAAPAKRVLAKSPPTRSAPAGKAAPAKHVASSTVAKKPVAKTPVAKKKAAAKPVEKVAPIKISRRAPVKREIGKVAVAVVAKPSAPVRKRKVKVIPHKTDEATGRPILPHGYKPDPDEEYMGVLQTEYFRQRLMAWRLDLVEESKQTIENLKDEVRDVGDEAERATRETENSLELRTRDRYRKLIGKIDSTLQRLDSGDYGFSVDSGEEIGLDRLEARLTAERTIDEQESWEHRQRQMRD